MREHYQVNEIFTSVQGEGYWTGKPATFIRLQGCMVGCPWCDTKYTWFKGGKRMTVGEIIAEVDTPHAVITGGEPTMYDLDSLIIALRMTGTTYVQLETSGQNELKGKKIPDWVTVSPKKNLDYKIPPMLFTQASEIKWVVDEELHLDPVLDLWGRYNATSTVLEPPWFYFMPEGCPSRPEMMEKTLRWLYFFPHDLQQRARICDRLQYRLGVR
jgi:7-carboxy-7-deazaguanine synthase